MKAKNQTFSRLWSRGDPTERTSALIVLAIFITIFCLIPSQIPMRGLIGPEIGYSPRLFPYIASIGGIIVGIGLVIKSFIIRTHPGTERASRDIIETSHLFRALGLFTVLVLYIPLFQFLGAIIALMLFLIALMWYFGLTWRKEWKVAVPIIIVFPVLVYYVFKLLLFVNLPGGLLQGFLYLIGWY